MKPVLELLAAAPCLLLLAAPGGAQSAPVLHQFTGFETGDLAEFSAPFPGAAVQSVETYTGGHALRTFGNEGEYAYATLFGVGSNGFSSSSLGIDRLDLAFMFRIGSWDQRVRFAEVGGVLGATKLRFELDVDGTIILEDHGTTRHFGTTQLVPDRWYRIEVRVDTGPQATLRLLLDGRLELFVTDANTSDELTHRIHFGRASSSGGTSEFFYDDVVVAEGGRLHGRVLMREPVADGAWSDWTGGFAEVDEWPHDGDATVAVSNGPGSSSGAFTSRVAPLAGPGSMGRVLAVKAYAVQRTDDGGVGSTSSSALRLRSRGQDFDTSGSDGGTAWRLRSRLFPSDPATGQRWRRSAVDRLEVGLAQLDAGITRATAVGVSVLVGSDPLVSKAPAASAWSTGPTLVGPTSIDLRRFTGFETGDLLEFDKAVGGVSVQGSEVHSGSHALRSTAQAGEYAYATLFDVAFNSFSPASFGLEDLHLSFMFRIASWDQRVRFAEVGGAQGATKLRIELEPDGRISVEDDGLNRTYGTRVLVPDRWYRIEVFVGTGTATSVRLAVDGVPDILDLDANTSDELGHRVHIGRPSTSGGASDFYYDDVVVSGAGFPGDARVALLRPEAAGTYGAWSGDWSDLRDWPHDGDLSVAGSLGAGSITTDLEPLVPVPGPGKLRILGLQAHGVQRGGGPGPSNGSLRLRVAGVDVDSPTSNGGTGWRLRTMLFTLDPSTGTPWRRQDLDTVEVGFRQVSGDQSLGTSAGASVLYARP